MKKEISPERSSRAEAFDLWMTSPMPMVTLVKTMDVSRMRRVSRKTGVKFTALMCWCLGKAASSIAEFYLLPQDGKLFQYDKLAINVIVQNCKGSISSCDIPFSDDIRQFNADYVKYTSAASMSGISTSLEDCMTIGTSALLQTELDSIVNQYSGRYNNPFIVWGRYHKGLLRTTLPVSLQFHHAQMDGEHACRFLQNVQEEIDRL